MEPDAVKQRAALAWEERPELLRHEGWKYIEKIMYMWGFSAGYRAALAASPSEEKVEGGRTRDGLRPSFPNPGSFRHDALAEDPPPAVDLDLAALRTTKEGE